MKLFQQPQEEWLLYSPWPWPQKPLTRESTARSPPLLLFSTPSNSASLSRTTSSNYHPICRPSERPKIGSSNFSNTWSALISWTLPLTRSVKRGNPRFRSFKKWWSSWAGPRRRISTGRIGSDKLWLLSKLSMKLRLTPWNLMGCLMRLLNLQDEYENILEQLRHRNIGELQVDKEAETVKSDLGTELEVEVLQRISETLAANDCLDICIGIFVKVREILPLSD